MEQFDMQLMLKDGAFADYQVKTEKNSKRYEVYSGESLVASFEDDSQGSFTLSDNPGNIDEDLQSRMIEQLKGFSA
ncbi:hypothetical protein B0I27_10181 [Arcticibacter pallidicorallinus]|uniref:Uncharacterized protein n=1 Tax=Arcticibacter pallidicorallinus TaxID=1259464 RepID=A0A2T0UB02_9SPHI|nr:hypothetical protein [Arcticibacter pallidicorallinus]PRY55116.1 hypothetical protein B0I27_10181 [Arcticibacter pallidicorallinus]